MDTNKKHEVRSGSGFEFQPTTEVEKLISTTVTQYFSERNLAASEFYICDENRITVGLVKNLCADSDFEEICKSLSEILNPQMERNGFKAIGPIKGGLYTMLTFVKESALRHLKPNAELQNDLERILTEAYSEYGHESTAQVVVDDKKEVQVWINSEKPYLGNAFWAFLGKTEEQVIAHLETQGYHYKKGEWLYDYRIMHFEYQA